MTANGDFEDRLDTRSRRVDAVAGERQAILRRDRARRRKEELARRLQRIHALLDEPSDPDHRAVVRIDRLDWAS